MALLIPFEGVSPRIHETAWVAPNATIIGDVTIEAHASVWYGSVIRADLAPVVLGEGSNLQDNCVIHVDTGVPTTIGAGVGIGHSAIVHGATVHDAALIGMGARLLNHSVVGSGSLVAAGAVLLEGHEVPPGSIAAGVPAKVRGEIEDPALRERVRINAEQYVKLAARHRGLEPLG